MAKTATKVIAGVLALAGVYFIYKYFKPEKKDKKGDTTPTPTLTPTPTPAPSKDAFPLKRGSRGAKVKELQQAIVDDGQATVVSLLGLVPTDGQFGAGTEKAVNALLGKKTIDSQADIDKIKGLKSKRAEDAVRVAQQQQAQQAITNRKYYGNLIVQGLCSDKFLYAVKPAKIYGYKMDSTKTREIERRTWTYKSGQFAAPWNSCNKIQSKTLDSQGFVIIWTIESGNNWYYSLSPYEFEVK